METFLKIKIFSISILYFYFFVSFCFFLFSFVSFLSALPMTLFVSCTWNLIMALNPKLKSKLNFCQLYLECANGTQTPLAHDLPASGSWEWAISGRTSAGWYRLKVHSFPLSSAAASLCASPLPPCLAPS